LIFAEDRYREIAEAFIAGIQQRAREGKSLDVTSVASVFVSRIDGLVDELLDKKGTPSARAMKGKAAVANTKLIYQAFKEIFRTPRFEALAKKGARVQRPLWGSTSTKNPEYPDLLYVEPLVGPDTVNTVPPQTYKAILDHAHPANTVEQGLSESRDVLTKLAAEGISLKQVLQKLEEDGVSAFEKSFNGLYENLNKKRGELVDVSLPS
jgi:transaldolase